MCEVWCLNMYVIVDTATGQWLTEPIPEQDARSLARVLTNSTTVRREVHVEEVEN